MQALWCALCDTILLTLWREFSLNTYQRVNIGYFHWSVSGSCLQKNYRCYCLGSGDTSVSCIGCLVSLDSILWIGCKVHRFSLFCVTMLWWHFCLTTVFKHFPLRKRLLQDSPPKKKIGVTWCHPLNVWGGVCIFDEEKHSATYFFHLFLRMLKCVLLPLPRTGSV